MRYVPAFCSMGFIFLWMAYIDWKTGYVYRFQSYLVIGIGLWIYGNSCGAWMHLQLLLYMTEICWLVKKKFLGRGDGYVYLAMAFSFAAITDSGGYLFLLFVHQLLANVLFVIVYRRQIKLPAWKLGACNAFVPSLFYSWISVLGSSVLISSSGR